MKLETVRRVLYKGQQDIGDYQAAKRGTLLPRLVRRAVRRRTGRVLGKWGL